MKRYTVVLLIVSFTVSFAQAPDTLWTKIYDTGGINAAWDMQQTSDGGYIIVGSTSFTNRSSDVWLLKTNSCGDTLWTKTFGGAKQDDGLAVKQTFDNGYIIAGKTSSFGAGYSDLYLIRTDPTGTMLWEKTYGDTLHDDGRDVVQISDGGFIVLGNIQSSGRLTDVWLLNINANGDTMWTRSYGDVLHEHAMELAQTSDGGYIVVGSKQSFNAGKKYDDVWLLKTDANGDTLWTRAYGDSLDDCGAGVQQTSDNGYIIIGQTDGRVPPGSSSYSSNLFLIKTDSLGDALWTRKYGGVGHQAGSSINQIMDGGYIISGRTKTPASANCDIWILRTNANGDTLWTREYGYQFVDDAFAVKQTADGGYIVAGMAFPNLWLAKIAPDTLAPLK